MKTTIAFALDTERDRDVIHWLDAQPNKSAAVREAIRAQMKKGGVTLGDIYEAIMELKRQGFASQGQPDGASPEGGDEPPDIVAALDNLGLK